MWAKAKQYGIQMVNEILAQGQVPTTAFIDGREICFLKYKFSYEIPSVHHNCNPNDQQNSHKLQIRTASSKNRKMNFRLEIKLTVNSSWFREAMWAKHKQSEIRMVRRNSTNASSDNCLYRWGEKFTFWNKFVLIKYCQYTMTAIRMIKRIRISSKFEQLPRKKEGELLSRTKTDSELMQMVKRISTRARSNNCLYWWGDKL